MGNTPEQDHELMADGLIRALDALKLASERLPVPISLPAVVPGMAAVELIEPIKQFRRLFEEEAITEDIKYHLDEAALSILAAIDLTRIAVSEEIDWRLDGVLMICTNSIHASTLAVVVLDKPFREKPHKG
ncbi:hypothetical protein [Nonomuraea fuscirosea]|uniref:hypothetical protein n=1 Tax=Nonomuraea fuscirosea TaxID=1291556 RepID=UPI00340DF79D